MRAIYKLLPQFLGKDAQLIRVSDLDSYAQRLVEFVKSADFVNEHNKK
jgi:hypothetical protein